MPQSIEKSLSQLLARGSELAITAGGTTSPVSKTNRVPTADYEMDVSRGLIAGEAPFQIIGFNNGLSTVEETIWGHSARWVPATTAETCNIVSTDIDDDDDPAGAGARTVAVSGIDGSLAEVSEVIALNGTSNVLTVNSYEAINSLMVLTAGASRTNEGAITAIQSSSGLVLNQMGPLLGVSRSAIVMVPAGKEFVGRDLLIIPGEINGATSFLEYHAYLYRTNGARIAIREGHATGPIDENIRFAPFAIQPGESIEFTGFTDAGSSSVQIVIQGVIFDL